VDPKDDRGPTTPDMLFHAVLGSQSTFYLFGQRSGSLGGGLATDARSTMRAAYGEVTQTLAALATDSTAHEQLPKQNRPRMQTR
jgi:hypothetical protein